MKNKSYALKVVRSLKENVFKKVGRWMVERLAHIPERDHSFTAWFILSFVITTTLSAIIIALGNPVGTTFFSHFMNIGKIVAINIILISVWTFIIAALSSFIYLPFPRVFLGSFSYTFVSTIVILIVAKSGLLFSFLIGVIYSLFSLFIGMTCVILFHRNSKRITKVTILFTILFLGSIYILFDEKSLNKNEIPTIAEYVSENVKENPANQGDYHYKFFTYGSGYDIHREEFGIAVDQVTRTVDSSSFITRWGKDREAFWGFDPSNLPVNGRVWLPEAEGSFPIILMVHGNHTMEHFSTAGYDYLGELFASRGFIAVSVDQDFINYSNAYGSPNDNYTLRAWMLLQHLLHLQNMNDDPNHYLYQKIDFQQTALVGHSRGGQAALMAADYKTFFDDKELLEAMDKIDIKAVAAIAPTDKSIDGKKPSVHNVSYLLLHGARDADVSTFRDQTFYRTTFDRDYNGFKASLYIADANHTHFNSNWGSMDLSLPKGIFLNQKQTMNPESQQQLAKVYLSAFFESVFHGHSFYEQLFQDYRYGKEWLTTNSTFVNKYRHASYIPIITFNQNESEIVDSDRLIDWKITTPQDRSGNSRLSDVLQLEWKTDASYTFDVSSDDFTARDYIVFTMANVNDDIELESVPEIHIELETNNGVSITLSLDDYMPFPQVISTDYTHYGLFDTIFREGRYKKSWEPVFQTFEVPIENFENINPDFKKENLHKITLHFTSHPGKILIEEIGVW